MKAASRFAMRHERKSIWLFCAIAALRVFIFSAAFPFFNNVDEQAHFDLVMKYARGDVPTNLGHYSFESANFIALYGTPEYFMTPQQFATNDFPPPNWTLPAEQRQQAVNTNSAWWLSNQNHESGEPPLYYIIAGLWLNLGRLFGVTGAWLSYWVRFLNVFVAGTLVWIGFVAAKLVFPDRQFIHFSVPILLAVWPQATFYSIQSGWQLVAASNRHVEWSEGVLGRTNGEFLAGRIHLAWQTTRFPSERRVLLDLFHARDWRGRGKSVSALNETAGFPP